MVQSFRKNRKTLKAVAALAAVTGLATLVLNRLSSEGASQHEVSKHSSTSLESLKNALQKIKDREKNRSDSQKLKDVEKNRRDSLQSKELKKILEPWKKKAESHTYESSPKKSVANVQHNNSVQTFSLNNDSFDEETGSVSNDPYYGNETPSPLADRYHIYGPQRSHYEKSSQRNALTRSYIGSNLDAKYPNHV